MSKMLITPQAYFNNPYHYDFASFGVLPTNEGNFAETIDDYIDEDITVSFDKQCGENVDSIKVTFSEEGYSRFEEYRASSPFCYFIIDYYFVRSKLEITALETDDEDDIEINTINYIADLIHFISMDMDLSIDFNTITGSVFIIKLVRRLRDINDDPVNEEHRKEYHSFFSGYKNLKSYCD